MSPIYEFNGHYYQIVRTQTVHVDNTLTEVTLDRMHMKWLHRCPTMGLKAIW